MPKIDVAGALLSYEDTGGSGEPVVLLHGFLFDGPQYEAIVESVQDRYRCLAVDFPGQGRSGSSPLGYSTEDLTEVITGFLDAVGLGAVHLVGLSMGGFTAMRIAARRPDLVRTLALLNTSARPHARKKFPKQLALAGVARAVGTAVGPVTAGIEQEMYAPGFLSDPATADLRAVWRRRWADADRAALVATLLGFMRRKDFRDELGSITAPTLIVAGEADLSLPPEQSIEIAEAIPGSRLVVLPGAGHSTAIEDPAGVVEALEGLWQSNT